MRQASFDQVIFIDALEKLNHLHGYLVVVEIDDKNGAVNLNDVLLDILKAEGILLNKV